jgi:hypothetical protein
LRFVDATPVFHVVRALPQTRRIVVEISKASVASGAKKAAQLAGLVAVINAELFELSLADCTSAVLPRHHNVVVLQRHPVMLLEIIFALIFGAQSKQLRPEFRLCRISVPMPRIALRLIGYSVGAVVRSPSFSFLL